MAFPTSIEAATYFLTAYNNLSTELTQIAGVSDTTVYVSSTANFPSAGWFTIEDEIRSYTGKTDYSFTGCTPGADNTTAAEHAAGTSVSLTLPAVAWNRVTTELRAALTKIGADSSAVTSTHDYKITTLEGKVTAGIADKTRHINLTPQGALLPAANYPAQAESDGTNFSYYTLDYDATTDEAAFWTFIVPDAYDGSTITAKAYYKTAATSGDAVFYCKTAGIAEGETLDSSLGTASTFTPDTVDATAGDLCVASKSFDPGWAAGDYVAFEFGRDANNASDSLAVDASVVMVELEWEVT